MKNRTPIITELDLFYRLKFCSIRENDYFSLQIPATTEIVFVPKKGRNSQFPGLFIFTTPGRMVRPVKNLALNKIELIGTFEQVYMDICIKLSEAYPGVSFYEILELLEFIFKLMIRSLPNIKKN